LAARGAQLAAGDLADAAALTRAAARVDAIVGLTVPFGRGGKEQEVTQGRVLVDVAAQFGTHLVYSSVRGANQPVDGKVAHASSKQLIEAYLRERGLPATVLGPAYFMENFLNVSFNQLRDGMLAMPLSPDKRLDQVTVQDIAGMAVHAIENRDALVSVRIDLASDSVTGTQAAAALSAILGREIPYRQIPIDQVRRRVGEEITTMFQRFEENTHHVDIPRLRSQYPGVRWSSTVSAFD
jgi:uncharacterized protein YbjT (DUF2867 family)